MGPDDREELFERARELSRQQRSWSDADATWVKVIDAYDAAVRDAPRPDRNDLRQLGRALWRRAMLLAMMGRPADAMAGGRRAVTLFEQLNDAVAGEEPEVTAPRRDEALAQLITAMIDLGEIAFAAGDADTRLALVDQALGAGLRVVQPPAAGPRTREAMATGYHNYATALLHRHLTQGGDVQEAVLAGSRAAQLRQELLDPRRPISLWELGNTYAIYAHCLALAGDLDRAATVLTLGGKLLEVLGPAGADIAVKLQTATAAVAEARRSGKRRWWPGRR